MIRERCVSRASVNFLLDCVLLVVFVVVLATTILLRALFPAPTEAAGWSVWGLGYDTWAAIHFWSMMVFAVGIGFHLILHWSWICGFVALKMSKFLGRRVVVIESLMTVYGVTTLIIVLTIVGAFIMAAQFGLDAPDGAPETPGSRSTQIRADTIEPAARP